MMASLTFFQVFAIEEHILHRCLGFVESVDILAFSVLLSLASEEYTLHHCAMREGCFTAVPFVSSFQQIPNGRQSHYPDITCGSINFRQIRIMAAHISSR